MNQKESINEILLYSTHCPKCRILEAKLRQKGIRYTEINEMEKIVATGFRSVPLLSVNGTIMDFSSAIKWVNEYEN